MRSYFRLMREKERWGWGRGQIDGLRRERCAPRAGGWSQPAAMRHGRGRPIRPLPVQDRGRRGCPAHSPGRVAGGLPSGYVKISPSQRAAPPASLRAKGLQGGGGLIAQLLPQILGRKSRFLWISLLVNGHRIFACVQLYKSDRYPRRSLARGSHLQSQARQACSLSSSTISTVASFSADIWLAHSKLLDFPEMERVWSSSGALSWSSELVLSWWPGNMVQTCSRSWI